ncbi:MAG: hypothetical protein IPJ94_27180 [Chloroflexi bacterium]|nr:hypothetical protein [Chloroflexota bacterium]
MMQALAGSIPAIAPVMRRDIMRFNTGEIVAQPGLPQMLVRAWSHYWRNSKDMTLFDVLLVYAGRAAFRFLRQPGAGQLCGPIIDGVGRKQRFCPIEKKTFF